MRISMNNILWGAFRDRVLTLLSFLMTPLFILCLSTGDLQAQDFFQWRRSYDNPNRCADCTFGHVTASYIIASELSDVMSWWKADLITLGIGTAYEIKDGYIPWEKVGILGGEGFSRWDITFDIVGILAHRFKDSIWEHRIRKHKHPERLRPE